MKNNIIAKWAYIVFFMVCAYLLPRNIVHAQITSDNYIMKSDVVPGTRLGVRDISGVTSDDHSLVRFNQYLSLRYTMDQFTDVASYTPWSYEVILKIMHTFDTTQYFIDTLHIQRNDSLPEYEALHYYNLPWSSLDIRVVSVCGTSGISTACVTNPETYPLIPEDIELSVAIIRTQIDGFAAMYDYASAPVEYDPDSVRQDCQEQYNEKRQQLNNEYEALTSQRQNDLAISLGLDTLEMNQLSDQVKETMQTWLNTWADTLITADTAYFFLCDSSILNSTQLTTIQNFTHSTLTNEYLDKYLQSYNNTAKQLYNGGIGTFAAANTLDSENNVSYFLGAHSYRTAQIYNGAILTDRLRSFYGCYKNHYLDLDQHWSPRATSFAHSLHNIRDSLLEENHIADSLYMHYQGGKAKIIQQTYQELLDAINTLNNEMYDYCGYSGQYTGGCQQYFDGLKNANNLYIKSLKDSVADTLANANGIPSVLLTEPSIGVSSIIGTQITQYYARIDSLDATWALCITDTAHIQSVLDILFSKTRELYSVPKSFLAARLALLQEHYSHTSLIMDSTAWNNMNDSLMASCANSVGTSVVNDKIAAVQAAYPTLYKCLLNNLAVYVTSSNTIMVDLLRSIDQALDTESVYAPISVYRYENILAQWIVGYENDSLYLAALVKANSLDDERAEKCGTVDIPRQSYLGCLTQAEATLDFYRAEKNRLTNLIDTITQDFSGIARPGGWNDANAYIPNLLDGLLAQYQYRFDTTALAILKTCIDSLEYQRAITALAYTPAQDQLYYADIFVPFFNNLAQLQPGDPDFPEYVSQHIETLHGDLLDVYVVYLLKRMDLKFDGFRATLAPNLTRDSCMSSIIAEGDPFMSIVEDFYNDYNTYLYAGASGITTDTAAYLRAVEYFTFCKIVFNNGYQKAFNEVLQQRDQCLHLLPSTPPSTSENPPPPTPSIEAEVAACQTNVVMQLEEILSNFSDRLAATFRLPFSIEINNGMDINPLQALKDNYLILLHHTLDPIDSTWLACNTNPTVLNILPTMFESDAMISALIYGTPYYVTHTDLLYVDEERTQPNYAHVSEFATMDSVYYMAGAYNRVDWIKSSLQRNVSLYGISDSCVIHHEIDSTSLVQYAASFAIWNNRLDAMYNTYTNLYDTSIISSDSLKLKLRWVIAAELTNTYELLMQYTRMELLYEGCEDLRNSLQIFMPEPSFERNITKKGIVDLSNIKPVGHGTKVPVTAGILDLTTSPVTIVTESGPCGMAKFVQWNIIPHALEYDLEWVYIDNEIYYNGIQANNLPDIKYLAFSGLSEPTRVTVKANRFPFPGEYPHGKLYFRVRGVARIIDHVHQSYSNPQYFPWAYNWTGYQVNSAPVNFNGENPFNGTFENNLNWQWETSFAEEGKFKRVISYYDGMNRPHQVVTHLSTEQLSVIGETLYDHEGRPVVQILPYPEPCYELSYRSQTRSDMNDSIFDKKDFELAAGNDSMNTTYGASQYYSTLNPFMAVENPLMHTGSIPDAQKYPYTQTAFMRDNTGRPLSSGGVGADHTLGGAHSTNYYYANASETELKRLFGKNVGVASHYKKNAVMDANGQLSIAYVDQEGRTIATALAGESPENVLALESNATNTITVNLSQNNHYWQNGSASEINYAQLNEIPGNKYNFSYDYGLDHLLDAQPCIICEYDLQVYITDPDGNRIPLTSIVDNGTAVPDTTFFTKHIDNSTYALANACSTIATPKELTFSVIMPEVNTYRIHKILIWDRNAALAALTASIQPGVNAHTDSVRTNMLSTYISQIDYEECNMFPGTGFGAIPADAVDNTYNLATTSQCESYLTQMIDQMTPYAGAGAPPSNDHPTSTTLVFNAGFYINNTAVWNKVKDLITSGIANPTNPAYIPPSVTVSYSNNGTANATTITNNIKAHPELWSDALKRELVKAHPEYCWYSKCLVYAGSVPHDADMAAIPNLTQGRIGKYMNPLNASSLPTPYSLVGNAGGSGTAHPDPIRNTTADVALIDNKMRAADATGNNLWDRTKIVLDNYATNSSITANQAAWQTFRGGYLQNKNDAFYTATSGCPFLADTLIAIIRPPAIPTTTAGMEAANEQNIDNWNSMQPCTGICHQNALAWASLLFANCGEPVVTGSTIVTYPQRDTIISYLEQYCLGQCGTQNPMGIITEHMLNEAMASSLGSPLYPLHQAVVLYNATFGDEHGCHPIVDSTTTGGATTWDAPFTFAAGTYTTQCTPFSVSLPTTYSVTKFIGKLNHAFAGLSSPLNTLNTAPWGTPTGANISISTLLMQGTTYQASCLLINVDGCGDNVFSRGGETNLVDPCTQCAVQFFTPNSDGVNNVLLKPPYVREIQSPNYGSMVIETNGDVTIPVTFKTSAISSGGAYITPISYQPGIVTFNIHGCCADSICRILPNAWDTVINTQSMVDSCEQMLLNEATTLAETTFNHFLDQYLDSLWHKAKCIIDEDLSMNFTKQEYHYTLYYYDQANNLVQTVPPKGVFPVSNAYFDVAGHWDGTHNPPHNMESRYRFNSLEVAVESETPDGGRSMYMPDALGRPHESANAQQRADAVSAATDPASPDNGKYVRIVSRTHYDKLGRIDSVYEQKVTAPYSSAAGYYPLPGQSGVNSSITQLTVTLYDTSLAVPLAGGWIAQNTRARVAAVRYYDRPNTAFRHGTYYSYDIHGNVKSMLTDVPALADFGQRYRKTDYYYNLVSGKVNEVHYQRGSSDAFFYRYTYDADNRLTMAETSRSYITWERDAKYFYYPHGPLKRVETGHRKVQGTDYFYTIHGWLKGVNAGSINEVNDLGRDGDIALPANPNKMVARDAFGFTLDYYNGDYKSINTGMTQVPTIAGSSFESAVLQNGLYNGNIVRMSTALLKIDETRMDVLGNAYQYDQLNRIRSNRSFITNSMHTDNSWSGITGTDKYRGDYKYDANGNILKLKRYDASATVTDNFTAYNYNAKPAPGLTMAGLEYNYVGPQNRLGYIDDSVSTLGMADQSANNYRYDEIGNLVKDVSEEIKEIRWTVYGKVRNVIREATSTKPDLDFYYNASGQRYMKVVKPKNTNGTLKTPDKWLFTYYQHDAQGNVLAIYEIADKDATCGYEMYLSQHVLYGSARLGVTNYGKDIKLGTMAHSFPYYAAPGGFYACVEHVDNTTDLIATVTSTTPVLQSAGGKLDRLAGWDMGILSSVDLSQVHGHNLPTTTNTATAGPIVKVPVSWKLGRKQYEFSNHLGNVLVTVSDMPKGIDEGSDGIVDYYMPDVLTVSDYEPFGAPLDGRTEKETSSYRFGFNGKEKIDEAYGDGNAYDFGARIYNPLIGRWLATDPLQQSYPFASPYNFALNSPITCADPDGQEVIITRKPKEGKDGRDLVLITVNAKWVDKTSRLEALKAQRTLVNELGISDPNSGKYKRQSKNLSSMEKNYDIYSKNEMAELKQSMESVYKKMDDKTEWRTEVTISNGTEGGIKESDHVFYAVNEVDGAHARASMAGGLAIYYSPNNTDFSLIKTKAHEIGHLLGLLHNMDNLYNGKSIIDYGRENKITTNEEVFIQFGVSLSNLMEYNNGTDLSSKQFEHIEQMYIDGCLNQGTNNYDPGHGDKNPILDGYEINYEK